MLLYETYIPDDVKDGAPVFVLLHGRGSHMGDLMGLQPYLPPEAIVVAPQAPFPGAQWGYGPGWAWYRVWRVPKPDPESFEKGQAELHEFLSALPGLLPVKRGPLILGGFSQGGVMSLAYALQHPGAVQMVVNFSGFLADHPGVEPTSENLAGLRIFWGHGTDDPMIPFALAQQGQQQLAAAGADLTARQYAIGHWIDGQELQDVVTWVRAGL